VPYSHVQNEVVEFRFVLESDADVTIEIYDYAMNLVKRVVDNESFAAGFYPTAGFGRRTWDGLNGEGIKVAVGVYYFKVELSTGDIRWGKLAVIP
jgi:flagellar hook assembly protein FlgD